MNPWLQQLLLGSMGLILVALAAGLWLRLWRRRPLDSYRLAVAVLFVSLSMPLAQWGVQHSRLLDDSPLVARIGSLGTNWFESEPALPYTRTSADRKLAIRSPEPDTGAAAVFGMFLAQGFNASEGQVSPVPVHMIPAEEGIPESFDHRATQENRWLGAIRYLLWAYGLGLVISLGRTGLRLMRTRGLLRSAVPVTDQRILGVWRTLVQGSPLRDRVRLRMTAEIRVPMCFGLGTPTVLIPAEDESRLSLELLSCVLLHELVHLERRDTWVMLGQELARSVFWFHPAAWWLCGRIDLLRELSCDLLVVRRTGRRKRYATALVEYAAHVRREIGLSKAQATVLLPWSSSNHQLSRRIEMLVNQSTSSGPRRAALLAAGTSFSLLFAGQLAVSAAMSPAQEVAVHETGAADDEEALVEIIELLSDDPGAEVPSDDDISVITLREFVGDEPHGHGQQAATVWVSEDDDAPMIGIRIGSMDGGRIVIEEVFHDSLAERAGLEAGDVIVNINGGDARWDELVKAKQSLRGGKIKLRVLRDGDEIKIKLDGKDLGDSASRRVVKERSKDSRFPGEIFDFVDGNHGGNLFQLRDDGQDGIHRLTDKLHKKLKLHSLFKDRIQDGQAGDGIHGITEEWVEKLRDGLGNTFFYSTDDDGEDSGDSHKSFSFRLNRRSSPDGEDDGDFHFDSSISGHPRFEFEGSLRSAADALKRAMKEHPEHVGTIQEALRALKDGDRGRSFVSEGFPKGRFHFRSRTPDGEDSPHDRHEARGRSFFGSRHGEGHGIENGRSDMTRELEKMRALIRERQEELQRLEKRLEELHSRTRSREHGSPRDHAVLFPPEVPTPVVNLEAPLVTFPSHSGRFLPGEFPALLPGPPAELLSPRVQLLR